MTESMMDLRAFVEKAPDADLLREMIAFAAERLMELEHNDEWAGQRARYITLESIAPVSDDPLVGLPATAARSIRLTPEIAALTNRQLHHGLGHDRRATAATSPGRLPGTLYIGLAYFSAAVAIAACKRLWKGNNRGP